MARSSLAQFKVCARLAEHVRALHQCSSQHTSDPHILSIVLLTEFYFIVIDKFPHFSNYYLGIHEAYSFVTKFCLLINHFIGWELLIAAAAAVVTGLRLLVFKPFFFH